MPLMSTLLESPLCDEAGCTNLRALLRVAPQIGGDGTGVAFWASDRYHYRD